MTAYRTIWQCLVGLLGAVGVAAAAVAVPAATLVALSICAGMMSGLVAASVLVVREDGETPPHLPRRVVSWGIAGAAAAIALIGMHALIGASALVLGLLLAAVSPATVRYLSGRAGTGDGIGFGSQRSGGAAPERQAEATASDRRRSELAAFSNADLCRAWQHSFDALRVTSSPTARLRIVQARQAYLDELERRDPEGLRAWLASSASAASDPGRFVSGGRDSDLGR